MTRRPDPIDAFAGALVVITALLVLAGAVSWVLRDAPTIVAVWAILAAIAVLWFIASQRARRHLKAGRHRR